MSSNLAALLEYFRKRNTFVLPLTVQHMPPAPHSLIWSCAGVSSALTQVYFVSTTLEVKALYKLSVANDITMFGDNQFSRHKEASCKFGGWMVVRTHCGFVTRYIKYFFVKTNFSCNTFPYKKISVFRPGGVTTLSTPHNQFIAALSTRFAWDARSEGAASHLHVNSSSTTQAFSRTGSEREAKSKRHLTSITPLMSSLGLNCMT